MWDERSDEEQPINEPKPPEYEFIMESDMNMFARMKIMDPDMPPPTIRTGKHQFCPNFSHQSRSRKVLVYIPS